MPALPSTHIKAAAPSFSDSWFGGYVINSPEKDKGIRAHVKISANRPSNNLGQDFGSGKTVSKRMDYMREDWAVEAEPILIIYFLSLKTIRFTNFAIRVTCNESTNNNI